MQQVHPGHELADLKNQVESLRVNNDQLWEYVVDFRERFDTLQTPLWKRIMFRLDGWPGQRNLRADKPTWRPWRRWWTS